MRHLRKIIFILPVVLLAACEANGPEWREQYREATYTVVNFIPEAGFHRLEVMLVPDSKGNYRMRNLSTGGTCREFIISHDPFIKVDSTAKWQLADWKWNLCISLNHVTIPLQWTDVQKPDNVYVRSDFETTATNIINRFYTIKRSNIDRYLGITPAPAADYPGPWGRTSGGISTDHLAPVYLNRYYSTQDIPDVIDRKGDWTYTKEDFLKERKRQDSLQNVYVKRLATLINEGDADIIFPLISE